MSTATPTSSVPPLTTASAYPLPPMRYISVYTDENVTSGAIPLPPKPLTDGQYSMFGQTIALDDAIIRSLESQGLRRLYPREVDHKRELKKINASILVNFLDLLDVLVRCPDTSKREEKCVDIQLLFITMHHLINELRPHQARETIRVWLQQQKKQRIDTTTRLKKQISRVNEVISNGINGITDSITSNSNGDTGDNIVNGDAIDKKNAINDAMDSLIDFKISPFGGHHLDMENNNASTDKSSFDENCVELDALMCNFVDEICTDLK